MERSITCSTSFSVRFDVDLWLDMTSLSNDSSSFRLTANSEIVPGWILFPAPCVEFHTLTKLAALLQSSTVHFFLRLHVSYTPFISGFAYALFTVIGAEFYSGDGGRAGAAMLARSAREIDFINYPMLLRRMGTWAIQNFRFFTQNFRFRFFFLCPKIWT